ncbi:DNA-binding protein inhibitor ID-2-like protein [Dinothrombium tinctorium]|uniref:DNA-binding protein inhibitor ID-2-like protein n=1 Tax=Dinothrombium tinctorium TaxID=1965070 RepID=A0A3S4RLU0_9ACAR|nr:DNA-binding protein inhibitor ID-2-like protein [Dinothrombium tinctorium]
MLPSPRSILENRVAKVKPPLKQLDNVSHEEMQQLLTKLKEIVPNMPKNKKLSKLEIIQNVIDYIFDLETALESHPSLASNVQNLSLQQCNNSSHNHHQKHFHIFVSGSS